MTLPNTPPMPRHKRIANAVALIVLMMRLPDMFSQNRFARSNLCGSSPNHCTTFSYFTCTINPFAACSLGASNTNTA